MNAGHLITRSKKKSFLKKFKILSYLEESESEKKPLRFYMQETEEEILAWNNGFALANKLNLGIDEHSYYKYAARFVCGYMAHATVNKTWLLK